jgi:hypothetical protein
MTLFRMAGSLLVVAVCVAAGCGPAGPVTYPLSGSVTWNGKPVPAGLMRLVPDAEAGNPGPATVAEIKQGRYATPEKKGIAGGKYRVFISGSDGIPVENTEEGTTDVLGRPLFTDVLQEVEFPRAAATHDFVLAPE